MTNPLGGLEQVRLVTPRKPHLVVPTLRDAEAAGITMDVDVGQQLLGNSPCGDSLTDVPLPNVSLPDVVGEE